LTTFGLQTIFSVLLLAIGLAYLTQRLKWTWQYSLYWCMMTALTVGYGDSPQCSTDADPPVGYVTTTPPQIPRPLFFFYCFSFFLFRFGKKGKS